MEKVYVWSCFVCYSDFEVFVCAESSMFLNKCYLYNVYFSLSVYWICKGSLLLMHKGNILLTV